MTAIFHKTINNLWLYGQ